jgi:hypothetical protein
MSWSLSWAALTLLLSALAVEASAADLPQSGVCMREGAKLAGIRPVQIRKGIPQPTKIRNASPNYPAVPQDTIVRGGTWVGEVLVDRQGSVIEVWSTREVGFEPPFPAFNRAIVDALRQWRFSPLVVRGQRVPWCTTVTNSINWS